MYYADDLNLRCILLSWVYKPRADWTGSPDVPLEAGKRILSMLPDKQATGSLGIDIYQGAIARCR